MRLDAPPAAPPVPTIAAGQVYTLAALTEALGLRRGTLPRELRLGRLRHAKRAGKVFILGAWVLDWLAAGERKRPADEDKADIAEA
jgi:hypothetical protein